MNHDLANNGLLVLPGWDESYGDRYRALESALSDRRWVCSRANLPDADWTPAERRHVTRDDSLGDALQDCASLQRQLPEGSSLALMGFSYGGYIATLMAVTPGVEWLILRSPAIYPDEHWFQPKEELDPDELSAYRRQVHPTSDNHALATCSAFEGDVLLVSSEFDLTIPREVIHSYRKAFSKARSLTEHCVPGADHELSDPQWRTEYQQVVVRWLLEHQHSSVAAM